LVSGGLDSAIIQAVAKADEVTCCHFVQDGIDTMPLALEGAQGAKIHAVTFGKEDVYKDLVAIAYHLDTPATWSALGHWFMAAENAKYGNKVVLTGEGADELFAGYTRYRILHHIDQAKLDPQLETYAPMFDYLIGSRNDILAKLLDRSSNGVARGHAKKLVEEYAGTPQQTRLGANLVPAMCRLDWHTTMQVLLRMADTMMSAFSLENRSPFLDYRLIELAMKMPNRHKIDHYSSKKVLREVAKRLGVSDAIVNCKDKKGLIVPWNVWHDEAGARGKYDRTDFADAMRAAWRQAWKL
jgi:asparagine synthase (glutamine-hydrolysing)